MGNEKLQMMKEALKETIAMKKYVKGKFQVFAWEAGVGKSKYTNEIIIETITDSLLHGGIKSTYLIVKKFISDVVETASFIKEGLTILKEDMVLGITSENYKEYQAAPNKVEDAVVVIITQERYIDFCKKGLPHQFKKTVLIMDEKMVVPIYTYSKSKYDKLRPYLKFSTQKKFDELNESLLEMLEQLDDAGKNKIEVTKVEDEYLLNLKVFKGQLKAEGVQDKFKDYLEELPLFFNSEMLYNNSSFYTFDKSFKFVMLENNIILDASATIDESYRSDLFEFVSVEKVVNYKDAKFVREIRNSSKSKMKKHVKSEMADLIRASQHIKEKELKKQVLYVIHKEHLDMFKQVWKDAHGTLDNLHISNESVEEANTFQFAVNWFGNLVGKNMYSDFNYCHVGGTNNLPYPVYILNYAFYNQIDSLAELNLEVKHGEFEFTKLESFRKSHLAAEFYQSIKRVQRNLEPEALFYIVNHDMEIIDLVANQMKNVRIFEYHDRDNPYDIKEQKTTTVDKVLTYIDSLEKGIHRKREIYKFLDIDSKNGYRIWNNENVKQLEIQNLIKVSHHVIEVF